MNRPRGGSLSERRTGPLSERRTQPNNLVSFEFVAYVSVPGLDEKLRLNYEDNAIITEKGLEALYPMEDRLMVIR